MVGRGHENPDLARRRPKEFFGKDGVFVGAARALFQKGASGSKPFLDDKVQRGARFRVPNREKRPSPLTSTSFASGWRRASASTPKTGGEPRPSRPDNRAGTAPQKPGLGSHPLRRSVSSFRQQQRVGLLLIRIDPRQWLPGALMMKLCRF